MKADKRWLDELPRSSAARPLLLAGKTARPPSGALESDWRALCAALGGVPGAMAASASAANQATSGVGAGASSGIVTKAGAAGLLGAGVTKSFFFGVVLGLGVAGAGTMVERLASKPPAADRGSSPSFTRAGEPGAGRVDSLVISPPEVGASPAPKSASDHRAPGARIDARPAPAEASPSPGATLSAQARELATIKRLLDRGDARLAAERLEVSARARTLTALSEERDALYVQALAQAGRRVEAQVLARRFIDQYPQSPYREMMRRLAVE